MNKSILVCVLAVLAMYGCVKEQEGIALLPPQGDPIRAITLSVNDVSKTRVWVDIDDSQVRDTYFWTAGDQIVLCETNGTTFTGTNYRYTLSSVPAVHGASGIFYADADEATTGGDYVAVHTRNWDNVVLPTSGTSLTCNLPTLTQSAPLTAFNSASAQVFADNLVFVTDRLSGVAFDTGSVSLDHLFTQIDVSVTGDATNDGSHIDQVELSPVTPDAFAASVTIGSGGARSPVGTGVSRTFITDANAKIDNTTPYKVRMLAIPTATESKASIKVYHSLSVGVATTDSPASLSAGEIRMLSQSVGVLTPIPTTPMSNTSYVGAFWKKDQRGERLIRNLVDPDDIGAWTASVFWRDANWAADDIVLSTASFSYPAGSVAVGADTPEVSGGSQSVSGTSAAGDFLTFKIGLKSTYTSTPESPARYAVIALSYNNNTKTQFIYLRQGEGADYLMRPTDNYGVLPSGMSQGSRPAAQKFSPYNLTDPVMGVGGSNISDHRTLAVNGGSFVNYPTQAGAFFQWANGTYPRKVYHPTNPSVVLDWDKSSPSEYWDTLESVHETCPTGYRRPNDGPINTGTPGAVSGSEMRQSLWLNPQLGIVSNIQNSVFGYYADGYFDRGTITNSSTSSILTTVVGAGSKDVAYVGRLFFNSSNNASLFFPAAGNRYYNTGTLQSAGTNGFYWSSSSFSTTESWSLGVYSDSNVGARLYNNPRGYSFAVRCISQPPVGANVPVGARYDQPW